MCARSDARPAPGMSARLPEALLDPLACPHRPDHVDLRETHISWVFLAGQRAYKVKKPIVLPFLDYRTLAPRRALCAEEVRLNRRLAPSVYVGVVALVARGAHGLEVRPECDPGAVEYAVEMRRYDEDVSDADQAVVAAQVAGDTGSLPLPAPPLAELDTERPVERLLDELGETLDAAL